MIDKINLINLLRRYIVMTNGMTLQQFSDAVSDRITNRNNQLDALFKEGKYDEMPKKFTFHSKIVTHGGEIISGKDSENYWRKVGEKIGNQEERKLNFAEKYFKAFELTVSPANKDEEYNFVAFEVTEFSFEARGKTYRGYIDPPARHRVKCTIDD